MLKGSKLMCNPNALKNPKQAIQGPSQWNDCSSIPLQERRGRGGAAATNDGFTETSRAPGGGREDGRKEGKEEE